MKSISLLVAGVFLSAFAASARADEGRVIEEELVLQDPTVAAAKHWAAGGSFEYWYVSGPYNTTDTSTGKRLATGTIDGKMPGGNFFIGYDNFTLQYSHRNGSFDVTRDFSNGAITDGVQKQTEDEVSLRYMVKTGPHFNPYFLVGFNGTTLKLTDTLRNATWGYNGKRVLSDKTVYNSGLIGIGAIIPFNQYVGMRADGRLMFTGGTYTRDDGLSQTGSGAGVAGTGTLYVNVFKGLNVQAGFKGQYLSAGTDIQSFGRFGMFGSVGYSYKF
jgi:hypothetical protein